MWNKYVLQSLLGTRATRITGFFVFVSFYVLLRLMGIVSRLLTVDGLVSLVLTAHQQLSFVLIVSLCRYSDLGLMYFYCKWHCFPQTQHLAVFPLVFPSSTGYLPDLLVLFCVLQGMTCISCSSVLAPVWVNHLRCGCHSQQEAEPYNHNMANDILWGLENQSFKESNIIQVLNLYRIYLFIWLVNRRLKRKTGKRNNIALFCNINSLILFQDKKLLHNRWIKEI